MQIFISMQLLTGGNYSLSVSALVLCLLSNKLSAQDYKLVWSDEFDGAVT
jgi:hypothetical protein